MNGVVGTTVAEAASVSMAKKSLDVQRQSGDAMLRLLDSLSGPRVMPPPPGSTVSVRA